MEIKRGSSRPFHSLAWVRAPQHQAILGPRSGFHQPSHLVPQRPVLGLTQTQRALSKEGRREAREEEEHKEVEAGSPPQESCKNLPEQKGPEEPSLTTRVGGHRSLPHLTAAEQKAIGGKLCL